MLSDFITPASEILSSYVGPDLPSGLYSHDRGRGSRTLFWLLQQSRVAVMLGDDGDYPWHSLPSEVENPNWTISWIAEVYPVVRPMSGRSASWNGAGSGDLIIGRGKILLGTVASGHGYGERGAAEVAGARETTSQEQIVYREWALMGRDAYGKSHLLFERKVRPAAER